MQHMYLKTRRPAVHNTALRSTACVILSTVTELSAHHEQFLRGSFKKLSAVKHYPAL